MKRTRSLLASIVSVVIAATALSPVFAVTSDTEETRNNREAATTKVEAKKTELATKLDAKRLELCEKKQSQIQTRISKLSGQGAKQLEVFNKIAERVQEFKETKNYTVDNYDAIVATVEEKRLTTQNAVTLTIDSGQGFVCSSEDPRGVANTFRDHLKLQISALKDYKTAIKDLIVAVKSSNSAQADTEGGSTDE